MGDSTKDSKPVPVMMIDQSMVDYMMTAAKNGVVTVEGVTYSSAAFLSTQAPKVKQPDTISLNRVCTIIIVNTLEDKLVLAENSFKDGQHWGKQTLHPAQGNLVKDGNYNGYSNPNEIPGKTTTDGDVLFGLGIYRFQKNFNVLGLGFYGAAGALSFRTPQLDLNDDLAIAFCVGEKDPTAVGVTVQPKHFGGIEKYYNKSIDDRTDNPRKRDGSSIAGGKVKMHASIQCWDGVYFGDKDDQTLQAYDSVVTVVVTPS